MGAIEYLRKAMHDFLAPQLRAIEERLKNLEVSQEAVLRNLRQGQEMMLTQFKNSPFPLIGHEELTWEQVITMNREARKQLAIAMNREAQKQRIERKASAVRPPSKDRSVNEDLDSK